ncbi:MAG: PIN domain-containing protein [Candidatus Verstraetearchaeota archaeon]|nr:PIN domain-containing protein [Candidatus Verstraetearchaeota archaeon]
MGLYSSHKTCVILDTNILIYSASKPLNIGRALSVLGFSRILVPSFVMDELDSIGRNRDKRGKFARLAREIAKNFPMIDVTVEGTDVDEKILHLAKSEGCAVATADSGLRRRLLSEGIPVVIMKRGGFLAFET